MNIAIGTKGYAEKTVTNENTAITLGSGDLSVFSTAMMVAIMEEASYTSVIPFLDEGDHTVGIGLNITHDSASPVGIKVWAESVVTAVDGKCITLDVVAYDEKGVIGKGEHKRFVVTADRFMAKTQKKLAE